MGWEEDSNRIKAQGMPQNPGMTQSVVPAGIPAGGPSDGWLEKSNAMIRRNEQEARQGPITDSISAGGGYNENADTSEFGFWDHMRNMLSPDDSTQIKRYSQSSGIPEKMFGKIDGKIVFWDGKNYKPVVPNVSGGGSLVDKIFRSGENVAAGTPRALPSVTGAVTGITMGPTVASVPVAGAVAGLTNLGLQALDKALSDDPEDEVFSTKYDGLSVLGDAALNSGGQLAGNALVKLFTKNPLGVKAFDRLKAMNPEELANAQNIQKIAKEEFNIDLTTGQATELRSMLGWERKAARWDETADQVYKYRDKQWGVDVPQAIRSSIDKISPQRGEDAVQAFKGGADDVIAEAEAKAQAAAKEHYTDAYAANQNMNSPYINRVLKTPSGKKALAEARDILQDDMALLTKPDPELTAIMNDMVMLGKMDKQSTRGVGEGFKLRTLDYVKRGLWRLEEKAKAANAGKAWDKSRTINKLRRKFTKELDRLDETQWAGANKNARKSAGGSYAQARSNFASGSEEAEVILTGGVGYLRNLKSDTAATVRKIFEDSASLTPEEVGRMRMMFHGANKGKEWDAGVARWLDDALNKATKEFKQGQGNVPGTFYATVWGTGEQKARTAAAIGNQRMPGFERLLMVLDKARKVLPEGSPTATDVGSVAPDKISSVVKGGAKLANVDTLANPGNAVSGFVADLRQPAARIRLADALFSADGTKVLSRLKMMNPKSEKAAKLVADFLTKAGVSSAKAPFSNETYRAPAEMKQNPRRRQ